MDNQHRKITGYRELTHEEISVMNSIKDTGEILETMCNALENEPHLDQRWIAIGKTHLQQGLMALTRAVAKPESF